VKADIVNAVNAGKVVTVSKTNITYNGWTGCGYIIIDPTTGNGAYMISGGMSGAIVVLLITMGLVLLVLAVATGAVVLVIVSILMPFYLSFLAWLSTNASKKIRNCITVIALSILAALLLKNILVLLPYKWLRHVINAIRTFFSQAQTQINCLGKNTAE
jgi:apolipoprotein N-acyltransferase